MIIKIDIDGVLRNTFRVMCELYNREFGTNMQISDIKDYDVNVSFPELKKRGIDAVDYFFNKNAEIVYSAEPCPGAVDAINRLRAAGHKVHICSHQPLAIGREVTLKFLTDNDIHYDGLHFTKDKWVVVADIIIDDCPGFLTHPNEISMPICISYPFNEHLRDMVRMPDLATATDNILQRNFFRDSEDMLDYMKNR